MYWNEASVRLFHDLADHDIISWDATGKIVRSSLTKRKLFYYEITARHPKKGMISVPLSVMISDTHTLPILQNWLTAFRHHEKEIFGSNNLSNPVQFNSDRALVLILAALSVINRENMAEFLERAWNIVTGQASLRELMKMNVHACAFHFMRDAKKVIKKYFTRKRSVSIYMWACSLMMNAASLEDLIDIFALIVRICCTKTVCKDLERDLTSLHDRIERFETVLKENGVQMEVEDLHESEVDVNDRLGTEEEMLNRSSDSKFRKEFEKVKQYNAEKCANDESRTTGSELNSLYEPELANNICKNLMPTAPLWSGLLLNDLSRHGDSKPYQDYKDKRKMGITSIKDRYRTFLNDNKTIGGSERRMGIMYELQMNSRSRIRLDDFFRTVHEDVIGLQRTFADQYRSSSTGRKRPKQTVTESWDKKRKGNPYSKKDVGYYQAAPPSRNPVSLKDYLPWPK